MHKLETLYGPDELSVEKKSVEREKCRIKTMVIILMLISQAVLFFLLIWSMP